MASAEEPTFGIRKITGRRNREFEPPEPVREEPLDDRTRSVQRHALAEARRLKHKAVGTEHLLLGLVAEDGLAARMLNRLGIDPSAIRKHLKTPSPTESAVVASAILPQTSRYRDAVEFAHCQSRDLGHGHVGGEHLLAGLLCEQDGIAVELLTRLGLNAEQARTRVEAFLSNPQSLLTDISSDLASHPAKTSGEPLRDTLELTVGALFRHANHLLSFLGTAMGIGATSRMTIRRSQLGQWWAEAPWNSGMVSPLVLAAGGTPFVPQRGSWISVGWDGLADDKDFDILDVSDWGAVQFQELVAECTLLRSRYSPASNLCALVPRQLGRWVVRLAMSRDLDVRMVPVRLEPLSGGESSNGLLMRLRSAGEIPGSVVQSIGNLPYTLVAQPANSDDGGIWVDVRYLAPAPIELLVSLVPPDETWTLGAPDVGYWRIRQRGDEVNGNLVLQMPEQKIVAAPPVSASDLNLKLPVQLAPLAGTGQADAVLLDSQELSWLRSFLIGRPLGETSFVISSGDSHFLTSPCGLPSILPFGTPMRRIGPGPLYVESGMGFQPPLPEDARQQCFQLDEGIVVGVTKHGSYRFPLDQMQPTWSLWIGELPQVVDLLPDEAGEPQLTAEQQDLHSVLRLVAKQYREQEGKLSGDQPRKPGASNRLRKLQAAQRAEMHGNLVEAARLLEEAGYPGPAGILYERAARAER